MKPPSLTKAEAQELYNHFRSGKAGWSSTAFSNLKNLTQYFGDKDTEMYKYILRCAGGRATAESNYQNSDFPRLYNTRISLGVLGSQIVSAESRERDPFDGLE